MEISLKDKKILVIVESPNKVHTITSILKNAGYKHATVVASVGHVMELKNGGSYHNTGIDPKNDFAMDLGISADKKQKVTEIAALAKDADIIALGSDDDREGTLISWSLLRFAKLPKTKCIRITMHEITPKAVVYALEHPVKLDENMVQAALARMSVDKMIGYALSPIAKTFVGARSVGRCQSAGLKLVADREREIQEFNPETYFDVYLNFEKNGSKFKAKYVGTAQKAVNHLKTQEEVDAAKAACGKNFEVLSVSTKKKQEAPSAPFSTATFQQEASSRLGLSVKEATAASQKLFESGKITYIRTDSTDMAPEFIPALKSYIEGAFGKGTFQQPRVAKKTGTEQDGHEALRVTDPNFTPDAAAASLGSPVLTKVYKLIWQRTIASAMPNAVKSETTYSIGSNDQRFSLVSNELLSPGFRQVYGYSDQDDKDQAVKETFKKGEKLKNCSLEDQKKQTQPPSRYTEATLVKKLQADGIGRPSTYATIINTVLDPTRGYARLENRKIVPTDLGMQLSSFLDKAFSNVISLTYTSELEEELDKIASGKLTKHDFMEAFYESLEGAIGKSQGAAIGKPDLPEQKCPLCGAPMTIRRSRYGKLFYGCSNYPKCHGIVSVSDALKK